jgi:CBS domain containing-hemolysin-like protein
MITRLVRASRRHPDLDQRTHGGHGGIDDDRRLQRNVGTKLPQLGVRTLAGVAFDALGRRLRAGDAVTVEGVEIRVKAVKGVRITRLEIVLPRPRDRQPPALQLVVPL